MGKGSTRRPTDEKTYQDNFDRIFGKKPLPNKDLPSPQSGSYSPAKLSGDYAGRVADAMSSLYRSNAETPFLQAVLKPRYSVVAGSVTAHCCFEATVVDTTRGGEPVCECLDETYAVIICAALNRRR